VKIIELKKKVKGEMDKMRMWNVNPKIMCNKHLLGEHLEMHMFIGCIVKKKSIQGYIDKGLVEVDNIIERHDSLVEEMKTRKMNHTTPIDNKVKLWVEGYVNVEMNEIILKERCKMCTRLQNEEE